MAVLVSTTSGNIATNGDIVALDCTGNSVAAVQIFGTWTGTIAFEGTIDGTNWRSAAAVPLAGGAAVANATAVGAWQVNTGGLVQVRARATAAITGTAVITIVADDGVASLIASGGGVGGPATVADGADVAQGTTTDAAGVSTVIGLLKQAITGWLSSHMSTNTTTTQKSGAGTLHSVTVNTLGVGNTLTLYDNTAASGTVIAVIDTTLSIPTRIYDVAFTTGLTAKTLGGTPPDITIAYR